MSLRYFAFVTALAVAAPTAAFAGEPTPTATVAVANSKAHAPTPSSSDATDYAQREKQEPKAADFQGGDMIVVGISGGALLVLLCLLIIL